LCQERIEYKSKSVLGTLTRQIFFNCTYETDNITTETHKWKG